MHRIAILISGEYRTFDNARGSFGFLNQSNADIYFSTWGTSRQFNKFLQIDTETVVTEEKIKNAIGDNVNLVAINIGNQAQFDNLRYNSKMINRWQTGLGMIINSNISYDYIVVVRPDVYFENAPSLDRYTALVSPGVMFEAWRRTDGSLKMADLMFIGDYKTVMSSLNDSRLATDWSKTLIDDWHDWFGQYFAKKQIVVNRPDINLIIARPNVTETDCSFEDFQLRFEDWKWSIIAAQRSEYGDDRLREIWGDKLIIEKLYEYINKRKFTWLV
jgi:hypothetical protein